MSPNEEPANNSFLIKTIDRLAPNPEKIADWVAELRAKNPEKSDEQIAHHIKKHIRRVFASQGAALSLPGAIPGLGTIAQISTEIGMASTDVALMIRNQTYMVFALGHCFGIKGREVLVQDTLICMGLWTNALVMTKAGAIRMGTKVVEANFKKRFPAKILQAINRKVGTTVLTKYGTKRGGIAIGKLIPFGVGVAIGGGFNYWTLSRFGKRSIRYLSAKV